jgi:CRISPR-associated protein Csb2
MLVWSIEYTAGSFHAPPWVRRCGPDEIEWPPSPWRLLEALVTGWRAAGWEDRERFLPILDALAEPPFFLLPRSMAAPSRHRYGAVVGKALAAGREDLAVDSYLAVEPDRAPRIRAYAVWPTVDFTEEQRALVQRCCRPVRKDRGKLASVEITSAKHKTEKAGRMAQKQLAAVAFFQNAAAHPSAYVAPDFALWRP